MLREIQLSGFKSFSADSARIPFAPVTVLVGANASGKSNLFDAVRFLQGIGLRLSIAEAIEGKWEGGREIHVGLRGGVSEACFTGMSTFTIGAKVLAPMWWTPNARHNAIPLAHRITVDTKAVMIGLKEETLTRRDDLLFDARAPDPRKRPGKFSVSVEAAFKGAEENGTPRKHFPHTFSLLWCLDPPPKGLHRSVLTGARALASEYASYRFLDLRPWAMRDYVSPQLPELGAHGENISSVVYRLCSKRDIKAQIVDWLSALCAPEIADVGFVETDIGDVLLKLVEGNGKQREISARSVSDGTLRFLGYLAAFFSAPEGSVFFIEEIENGLHPTRVHLLVELLEQFAESRRLQIIATTHSSQVLLSLSESALRNVVLFARPEGTSRTVTQRLGDLSHFEEVTKHTHIDQLFSTGWLEHAL